MDPAEINLKGFLLDYRPFATLGEDLVAAMAEAARVDRFQPGELIVDAFVQPTSEMFVVVEGAVDVWNDRTRIIEVPTERLGPGKVFGFSSMLTERSVGPRAVAAGPTIVAAIPGPVVEPVFTSPDGARFLVEQAPVAEEHVVQRPTYSLVDDLIVTQPLAVAPSLPAAEVARRMSERNLNCAVVQHDGTYAILTDAILRHELIVEAQPASTPVGALAPTPARAVRLGDSATEALIALLETDENFLIVVDAANQLQGIVAPRDFAISPTTAGATVHEQLRRAGDTDELVARARRITETLDHLLTAGLTADRVIAVYSTMLDTLVRRAITLVFDAHPELSTDAFTWLSLGSNGRREAVPSSDADTAVAFNDGLEEADRPRYRRAFDEVHEVLRRAGLSSDAHGATAGQTTFSRTNTEWSLAARDWIIDPTKNKGAVMTSLLVDARPIYGDAGLPGVTPVFTALREHPGTMRLLLEESLSRRARRRPALDQLVRREEAFDIKRRAILPVVNLARWASLSVGSAVLPTVERLRAAAGSAMLPATQASTLIEAFQVLQNLRLHCQLAQLRQDLPPTDEILLDELSPIDRSVVHQAVREVAAAQRRMDNVAQYVPVEGWTAPED